MPVDLVAILKIASFVIIQITSGDLSRTWLRLLRQVGPERPHARRSVMSLAVAPIGGTYGSISAS